MTTLRTVLLLLLQGYWVILLVRLVLGYVQAFARQWRPRGIVLVVAESAYTMTDPPLRLLRRVLPPLRVGPIVLDLGMLALFVLLAVAMKVVA